MRYTTLGRTGLRVSVAGLGCGGPSRLGLATGGSRTDAVTIVRHGLELGINFFDTSPLYATEAFVGEGLIGRRAEVVVSTKVRLGAAGEIRASVENSLVQLRTDYVDVLFVHGVAPQEYQRCVEEMLPVMRQLQRDGKIRFVGLTESFDADPQHAMLAQALPQGFWDCAMFGYSPLNRSAADVVLPLARDHGVGTMVMRPVRDVAAQGASACLSSVPAHYAFCARTDGVHAVLTGTGSLSHLADNVASIVLSTAQ